MSTIAREILKQRPTMTEAQDFLNTSEDKYISYFLEKDSIRNLDSELGISLNRKYKCTLGCEVCYVPEWMSHKDFVPFAEASQEAMTEQWKEDLFDLMSNFYDISTFEDLYYLKKRFPKQYEFYAEHAGIMSMSSFTDDGFEKHMDVIMDDMTFKDVFEITFSTKYLAKHRDKIEYMLLKVWEKYDIRHIKIILQANMTEEEHKEHNTFVEFLKKHDQPTFGMFDILEGWMETEEFPCAVYSENGNLYHSLNNMLYVACDELYLDFNDFTSKDASSYCIGKLSDVKGSLINIMPALLDTKIKRYAADAEKITDKGTQFHRYFKKIGESLKVNYEFNYIPYIMLNEYAPWMQKAMNSGKWRRVPQGLIRTDAEKPISIIEKR